MTKKIPAKILMSKASNHKLRTANFEESAYPKAGNLGQLPYTRDEKRLPASELYSVEGVGSI